MRYLLLSEYYAFSILPPAASTFFAAPFEQGSFTINATFKSPSPNILTPFLTASGATILYLTNETTSTTVSFGNRLRYFTLIASGCFLYCLFLLRPRRNGRRLMS